MNMQIPEWVKPGLWGAVVGAVVLAIIAFNAGWVVTSGTAQEMAERQAENAVISSLTPICVAQFKNETEKQTLLASLKEEDSWKQGDFVQTHGWATMPGSSKPNDEVADACASELLEVAQQ